MGGKYQPLEPNAQGWLWSQLLELFLGVYESQLRFFTPENQLVSAPEERAETARKQAEAAQEQAETARKQAEAERQQKELAQQRVEELLARLKEMGVEPDVQEQ
jgi:F0F1-type ATP synthase membrane subunit b/b'